MDAGRFRRGAFIGRGSSGDVYAGVDTLTGDCVAIKSVDCSRFHSIAELEAAQSEIALLSSLHHCFIVRLLDVQIAPTAIHFVMEHAGGGTLAQLLARQEGRQLDEPEAQRIFLQIFQAVDFCHRRCVVHRDLKPENILLDYHRNVKVADFGLASILTPFDGVVSSLVGTPEFIAPDLLVSASCEGAKADLWSLGVMLYEALAGHTPFSGPNLAAILRAALKNEYAPLPEGVSQDCRDLVAALLRPDPLRRITMDQVLAHPWVLPGLMEGRTLSPPPSEEESAEEEANGERCSKEGKAAGEQLCNESLLEAATAGIDAAGCTAGQWGRVRCGEAVAALPGQHSAAAVGGAGAGARLCCSSPGSLGTSLVRQSSSLTLVLPGMGRDHAEGGHGEPSGQMPSIAEKHASGPLPPRHAAADPAERFYRSHSVPPSAALGKHGSSSSSKSKSSSSLSRQQREQHRQPRPTCSSPPVSRPDTAKSFSASATARGPPSTTARVLERPATAYK